MQLVSRGEAPYGIVYQTDANADATVAVVGIFPESSHKPIVYPVALTVSSTSAAAKDYLVFLKSDQAKALFTAQGFSVLN